MADGSTAGRAAGRPKTPKHLWVVGVVALLWNSMGALDYTMTQTKNMAYLKQLTPPQLDYFFGLPAWVVAAWAIGVWGGVVGSLLLLLRKRLAVPVFLASILGVVGSHGYTYLLSNGLEVMGGGAGTLAFAATILLVAVALYVYARALARREVLV
jgi:hypothetical protein